MSDFSQEKAINFWNKIAASDTIPEIKGMLLTESSLISALYRDYSEKQHFKQFLPISKSADILEVGCGTGRWSFYLAEQARHVDAIDPSMEMIKICNKINQTKRQANITFLHGLFETLDLGLRLYDVIYFSGCLQYIEDEVLDKILQKCRHHLTPKGLILSRDTISSTDRTVKTGDYNVIYRTREEHIGIFRRHGFSLQYNALSFPTRISRGLNRLSPLYRMGLLPFSMVLTLDSFIKSVFGATPIVPTNTSHCFFLYRPSENPIKSD